MYKYEVCIKYRRFSFHIGDFDAKIKIKQFYELAEVVEFINIEQAKNNWFYLCYISEVKI